MYSLGMYTRETETTRWSSISFDELARELDRLDVRAEARPKTPSNRDSIRCSMFAEDGHAATVMPPARTTNSRP